MSTPQPTPQQQVLIDVDTHMKVSQLIQEELGKQAHYDHHRSLSSRHSNDCTLIDGAEYFTDINSKDTITFIAGQEDFPEGICKFVASRAHVAALSPRFKELVDRQTRTVRRLFRSHAVTKRIVLSGDTALSVRLILCLAHVQYTRLPRRLDFPDIVRLTETAERFEIHGLIVPHLTPWLKPYYKNLLTPGFEQWLYISYHYWFDKVMFQLASYLALHNPVDNRGRLLATKSNELIEGVYPPGLLSIVEQARLKLLNLIWHDIYTTLCHAVKHGCCTRNEDPEVRFTCTAKNLLGFQRYLSLHGLTCPTPAPSTVRRAVNDIINIFMRGDAAHSMQHAVVRDLDAISDCADMSSESHMEIHEECCIVIPLQAQLQRTLHANAWTEGLGEYALARKLPVQEAEVRLS